MERKMIIKGIVLLMLLGLLIPTIGFAESADSVVNVSVCGPDVLIEMHNAGWVVARESDIGKDNLDDIISVALELLQSEAPTGYFDPGDPIDVCDIEQVRPITTLEPEKQK